MSASGEPAYTRNLSPIGQTDLNTLHNVILSNNTPPYFHCQYPNGAMNSLRVAGN